MTNLKPCPFCGAAPKWGPGFGWEIGCPSTDCVHVESCRGTREQAEKVWNRRTPSPAVRALVDELRAYIAELRRGSSGRRFIVEEALAAVEREIGEA